MIGKLITNRPKPSAQIMPDEVSDEEMQRMLAANKPAAPTNTLPDEMSDEEMQAALEKQNAPPSIPKGSFMGNDGEIHQNTMSDRDRREGALLGTLEFPMMGFNDEYAGTTGALIDQATHAGAGGIVELAKQFGVDPKVASKFLGYDPNFKPDTMQEGREKMSALKDRYAKARESGEIGFWSPENVASNAVGMGSSIVPYEGVFNLWKAGTGMIPKIPGWVSTGASLLGTGATATALTEAGDAIGTPEDRVQKVVKAGGGPLVVGAMLNILGAGVGKGIGLGIKAGANQMAPIAKIAYRRLAELANDAGISIEDLAKSFYENHAIKPEATLAEAGPNWFRGWQAEAGAVARSPDTADVAARTLIDRQRGSSSRMASNIEDAFNTGDSGFKQTFNELDEASSKAAKPLYDEAHPIPVNSPELETYLNSATGKEAFQDALDLANIDNVPVQELVPHDANGQIIGYPTKLLDYMQRAMRGKASKAYSSGDSARGEAFKNWRERFVDIVDKLNPKFKAARAAYAGPQANQDALVLGRTLVDQPPKYIEAQLAALGSDAERNFLKQGYGQKLLEEIRKTPYGGNVGYKMTNNLAREQAAEQVLGKDVWAKLQRQAQLEDRMTGTVNEVAANSKTVQRALHHEDSNAQTLESLEMLEKLAHAGPANLVKQVGMSGIAGWLRHVQKAKRAELAKMLFSNNPEFVKEALANIAKEVPHAEFWKKLGQSTEKIGSPLVTSTGQPIANRFAASDQPY